MKILITGATGLIGTRLVALLSEKKFDIHYLTLHQHEINNREGVRGFLWDPLRGKIDENSMIGVDVIVHLAGAPIAKRWTSAYKQEIIESRTMSANLLYKTLKSNPHQVKHIISASAIGIYPDSLTKHYTESNTETDDSFLGNVVVKWENSINKFRQLDISVCKIRTGLVLAREGGVLQELVKPVKLGVGAPFGTGHQWQSWIHINDVVALYHYAIVNQLDGIYNATAPNPVTNKTLTVAIAKQLHIPLFLPAVPRFLMKLLLGEMHMLLFSSQYVLPKKAQDNGFTFEYTQLEPALHDLLSDN